MQDDRRKCRTLGSEELAAAMPPRYVTQSHVHGDCAPPRFINFVIKSVQIPQRSYESGLGMSVGCLRLAGCYVRDLSLGMSDDGGWYRLMACRGTICIDDKEALLSVKRKNRGHGQEYDSIMLIWQPVSNLAFQTANTCCIELF